MRSPWLGVLVISIAGVVGYMVSDAKPEETLDAVAVDIRPTRDTGAGWDFGGGMPDPRVRVEQAGTVLATCEAKDVVKLTCAVGKAVDRAKVRVIVVDIDSSDDDPIGDAKLDESSGALTTHAILSGGAGAWTRFRALWIALAIGIVIATGLAILRRRRVA
jgi:hypothetical protein